MRTRIWLSVLVLTATGATAQEYRIDRPSDLAPTPVYVTRPVEGRVEVTNIPGVQEVRVTGGSLDSPVEVRGEVGLRIQQPLLVEVSNPVEFPQPLPVEGTVRIEDSAPLRVMVENFPAPPREPERLFAAYHFRGAFSSKESKTRRSFQPPEGAVFHVTDLIVDARADAVLKVRLVAPPAAIRGAVAGAEEDGLPLAIVETQKGTWERLGTPVPLGAQFTVEVEALGPGQGAPFRVVASGYLAPAGR